MCGALLGVLACGCFWFQQLLVPLHLALHQHTLVAAQHDDPHAQHEHEHTETDPEGDVRHSLSLRQGWTGIAASAGPL